MKINFLYSSYVMHSGLTIRNYSELYEIFLYNMKNVKIRHSPHQ